MKFWKFTLRFCLYSFNENFYSINIVFFIILIFWIFLIHYFIVFKIHSRKNSCQNTSSHKELKNFILNESLTLSTFNVSLINFWWLNQFDSLYFCNIKIIVINIIEIKMMWRGNSWFIKIKIKIKFICHKIP